MAFLTNVWSEQQKRQRRHPGVARWYGGVETGDLF
jgi:hypothetical protein